MTDRQFSLTNPLCELFSRRIRIQEIWSPSAFPAYISIYVQVKFDFYISLDAILVLAVGCWFHTSSFLQRVSSAVWDSKSFFSTIKESCSVAGRRSIFSRAFFFFFYSSWHPNYRQFSQVKYSPGKMQSFPVFVSYISAVLSLVLLCAFPHLPVVLHTCSSSANGARAAQTPPVWSPDPWVWWFATL